MSEEVEEAHKTIQVHAIFPNRSSKHSQRYYKKHTYAVFVIFVQFHLFPFMLS